MKVIIKNVTIVDATSPHHLKKRDVLIENGIYSKIASNITNTLKATEIDGSKAFLSMGWMDLFSNFCEPGYENYETLASGKNAAAAGGYTDVAIIPNTKVITDNSTQIQFLKNKNELVQLHPLGAITQQAEGKQLAEMMDMHKHGALAFTDGLNTVQDASIFLKALQYTKSIDSILIQIPVHKSLSSNKFMHEGIVSTLLGISSEPSLAEVLMIQRDIEILRYTNGKLHITGVSSSKGLALIKQAKKEGLSITCSCTPHHLLYTDADLCTYDSNYKVKPPFRTKTDKDALIKALLDGTIDAIASHHNPTDWDGKNQEFEYAKQGLSSIETVLHSLLSVPKLQNEIPLIVKLLTKGREIFSMPIPNIIQGGICNATLFSAANGKLYDMQTKKSAGINNVHLNKTLKGKIIATFNNSKYQIHE